MVNEQSLAETTSPAQLPNTNQCVAESPQRPPRFRTNLRLIASVPCNLNQLATSAGQPALAGTPPLTMSTVSSTHELQVASSESSRATTSSESDDGDISPMSCKSTHSGIFVTTSVVRNPGHRSAFCRPHSIGYQLDLEDSSVNRPPLTPFGFASHSQLHSSRSLPVDSFSSPTQSPVTSPTQFPSRSIPPPYYRRNNTWSTATTQILAHRPLTSLTNTVISGLRSPSNTSFGTAMPASSPNSCSYSTASNQQQTPESDTGLQLPENRRFSLPLVSVSVQRLDLQRQNPEDTDAVRGQIVISLISRDRGTPVSSPTGTGIQSPSIPYDPNELPEG